MAMVMVMEIAVVVAVTTAVLAEVREAELPELHTTVGRLTHLKATEGGWPEPTDMMTMLRPG